MVADSVVLTMVDAVAGVFSSKLINECCELVCMPVVLYKDVKAGSEVDVVVNKVVRQI